MASVTVFSTAGAAVSAGAAVASAVAAGAALEFAALPLLLLPQADKNTVIVRSPAKTSFILPDFFLSNKYI
ncbi:hypothetical protein D3C86_2218710 [compost metagenome]